jgi:formate hydrogenlyase subunit 4
LEVVGTFGNFLLFLLTPFFGIGILRSTRGKCQGRRGPRVFQPFFDWIRPLQKKPTDGPFTGNFGEVAPFLSALSALVAWSIIVFEWTSSTWILALFSLQFAALTGFAVETGTSFGGLGSSREVLITSLAKPSLILIAIVYGALDFITGTEIRLILYFCFAFLGLLILLAETARPPYDDPRTHLELTMVHEAMLLEASGKTLALFELSAFLKTATLVTLVMKLFLLGGLEISPVIISKSLVPYLLFGFNLILYSCLGFWEASSVRRKWSWIPESLVLIFLGCLFLLGLAFSASQGLLW